MKKRGLLSLVVPAYKQEKTIEEDIKRLSKFLPLLPLDYEIIVVVDGFEDKTFALAKRCENKRIKVFGYKNNQGKGYAVKYGILKARGDLIGFIDAGGDIDPSSIRILVDAFSKNTIDIAVGSKLHPQSNINYPLIRKILSLGYRNISRVLFGFNVQDTQVGLKIFRKKVARDIFKRVTIKKFAFDIEVLAIANSLGYRNIIESPVKLSLSGESSLNSKSFWKLVPRIFLDTLIVFYRLRLVRYYDRINH